MVQRLKLSEKVLREAKPAAGRSYQIFDTDIIGLAAKVQCSGMRCFTLDYRHAGRQRRMSIGHWPDWSVTAARERAKELRRMIDEGEDPLAAKEELREAPRVTDMFARFIREHLPRFGLICFNLTKPLSWRNFAGKDGPPMDRERCREPLASKLPDGIEDAGVVSRLPNELTQV